MKIRKKSWIRAKYQKGVDSLLTKLCNLRVSGLSKHAEYGAEHEI